MRPERVLHTLRVLVSDAAGGIEIRHEVIAVHAAPRRREWRQHLAVPSPGALVLLALA